MATSRKFEEMLEKLVNEDKAGAEELFHEIVVEKSRDIYEGILEAELAETAPDDGTRGGQKSGSGEDEGEVGDATGGKRTGEKGKKMPVGKPTPKKDAEKVKESSDDEEVEEDFDLDEFDVVEADPTDDMIDTVSSDEMGGEMPAGDMGDMDMDMDMEGGEGEIEDRVEDLEDALDELKAEFEAMMSDAGDDAGDDMDDMDDMGGDDAEDEDDDEDDGEEMEAMEASDEEVDEATDEEVDESDDDEPKSQTEQMREYVEKVTASMGDNGANSKSVVAGKNDMGGTASNLVAGGEADSKGTGASAPKEDSAGNVNVPGGKAAKSLAKNAKGHGAEKKGAGETADNKKSTIGS